jgi:hypothetical protein
VSYDFKRGFHRIFAVLTILWIFVCILYPIWERDQLFKNFGAQYSRMRADCDVCPEYLSASACERLVSDCQKRWDKAEDDMLQENPLSKWYRKAWPFIIAFAVVVPVIAYWAVGGVIAVLLWVKKGFQDPNATSA